jgi:D-psicose/D-tagatose/L-ribulose 3-epimerase
MKRLIGIHLSYWQTRWSDDLIPLIIKAHQAGFEVAEFPLLFPQTLAYGELRSMLDRLGMRASCSTGLGRETDVTSPDRSVREAGIAHLRACIEGAVRLGSPVLVGVTYAPWGYVPESGLEERRQQCIQSLQLTSRMARDHGITLCMEVINRFEGYLINTVEMGLGIIRAVNDPSLRLHLDTFHMNIEEDNIGRAIRQAGSLLGHLHCSENNRGIPGTGHIPWAEVRDAVDEVGYNGFVVAETFVNPAGEVGRDLNTWKPLTDDLDGSAYQAVAFLRNEFSRV